MDWWNLGVQRIEAELQRHYLIALPDMARMIAVDNCSTRGGYATINKVPIEGALGIEPFWEFSVKISNQNLTRSYLAKLEHQYESMAVTIPHVGVIQYVAIHT
jgi:hypothetical protein